MMTTIHRYEPTDLGITIEELRLPREMQRQGEIAARQAAFAAVDPMVRRLSGRLAADLFTRVQAPTVYDAIYPNTPEIGGFWTVAGRWIGLFTHTIATYTVALAFDEHANPDHFVVTGSRELRTTNASEEALSRAIDEVRLGGPLTTIAPHAFASIGL